MKKYLLYCLLFVLILTPTFAWVRQKYYFGSTSTSSITDVKVVAWACTSSDCSTVDTTKRLSYFLNNQVNTIPANGVVITQNNINILFPDNFMTTSNKYLILFFHDNYISKNRRPGSAYPGNPNQFYDAPDFFFTPPFEKKANCNAPSTLTVQNKIGEWLPLTIDTTSQLDTETSSAIVTTTGVYLPTTNPNFANYFQVATTVTLQIKDKKTNAIVKTDSKNLMIPWDSSLPTTFSWSSADPSYKPGNYTVILTSHVSDTKCSSFIDDVKTQDIEIFPALPNDACVIIADPMTLKAPITKKQTGQIDISAYFYHMIKSYDANYNMHLTYKGIPAQYTLTFTNLSNKIDKTISGTWQKAFTDTRIDTAPSKATNTIAWTPLSYGDYQVKLVMISNDPLCVNKVNDFTRGTRTETLSVKVVDKDLDRYPEDVDCDDNNYYINPGAADTTCDGIDQNCDGVDRTLANQCQCLEFTRKSCADFGRLGMCALPEVTCTNGAYPACPSKVSNEICDDALKNDEDCDGKSNCDDPDCANYFKGNMNYCLNYCSTGFYDINRNIADGCEYACTPKNNGIELCSDTLLVDEDCDGVANCQDTDCIGFVQDFLKPCLNVCMGNHFDLNKDKSDGCEYACTPSNMRIYL